MNIAVILVNWNQSGTTCRCMESLFQNTDAKAGFSFRVIVIDNGSDRQEVKLLESYLAESPYRTAIHLIRNAENAGFAGGNNLGIRYALAHCDPDYIWLLNNDIIVQEGALDHLAAAALQHPKPKIWGSTIYEIAPELHFHCAGGFTYNAWLSIPTPITFPKEQALPTGLHYPLPQMDYPAGAAMFVRADTFRKSGLLNEIYFLYYEELDLVHQIGGKSHLAWCPDSVLHHQSGTSTGSQNPNTGHGSWIAHYYGNLSALKYTWLYHRPYFQIVFLFRLLTKSVLFVLYRDFRSFSPLKKAYRDFFKWRRNYEKTEA